MMIPAELQCEKFEKPEFAATALANAASNGESGDIVRIVTILSDKSAFTQLAEYLSLSSGQVVLNSAWVLKKAKRALDDSENLYEARPIHLANARFALFKLMRANKLRSIKLATWVCSPYCSPFRMMHVGILLATPASRVAF